MLCFSQTYDRPEVLQIFHLNERDSCIIFSPEEVTYWSEAVSLSFVLWKKSDGIASHQRVRELGTFKAGEQML